MVCSSRMLCVFMICLFKLMLLLSLGLWTLLSNDALLLAALLSKLLKLGATGLARPKLVKLAPNTAVGSIGPCSCVC